MKFWRCCLIFFIFCACQLDRSTESIGNDFNETIEPLKKYDINSVKIILDTLPESLTRDIIAAEYKYLKTGESSGRLYEKIPKDFKTTKEEIIYNYSYGDYLFRKSKPIDTLSFKYYLKAYSIAKDEENIELTIESLKRINNFFKEYNLGLNEHNGSIHKYQEYNSELIDLAKDSCDIFWAKYYDLHLRILRIYNNEISINSLELEDFQNALNFVPADPYFKGIIYQLQGIYYTLLKKNSVKGKESNKVAREYYLESNIFPSVRAIFGLKVNDAIAEYGMHNYDIAIEKFKSNLKNIPYDKSYQFERWFTYAHLDTVYTLINDKDSLIFYKNLAIKFKKSINSELLLISMYRESETSEITRLQKLINAFRRHRIIYGIVIFIILLLTLYSLVRWFRVDKVNRTLKREKKQTSEELTAVKQLVIKDSIILKNRSKILLDELMYIKADDHYLTLYTFNENTLKEKKEFVRGKIKDIIKELPPNFKQCHRSYIVNCNKCRSTTHKNILLDNDQYIPLSRTFKNDF